MPKSYLKFSPSPSYPAWFEEEKTQKEITKTEKMRKKMKWQNCRRDLDRKLGKKRKRRRRKKQKSNAQESSPSQREQRNSRNWWKHEATKKELLFLTIAEQKTKPKPRISRCLYNFAVTITVPALRLWFWSTCVFFFLVCFHCSNGSWWWCADCRRLLCRRENL